MSEKVIQLANRVSPEKQQKIEAQAREPEQNVYSIEQQQIRTYVRLALAEVGICERKNLINMTIEEFIDIGQEHGYFIKGERHNAFDLCNLLFPEKDHWAYDHISLTEIVDILWPSNKA